MLGIAKKQQSCKGNAEKIVYHAHQEIYGRKIEEKRRGILEKMQLVWFLN